MGYSASLLEGRPIELRTDDLEGLIKALQDLGQLSWCNGTEEYFKGAASDTERKQAVARVLNDFGFEMEVDYIKSTWIFNVAEGLAIQGWGGDKLGSTWEAIWSWIDRFAAGPYVWIMSGEDGLIWAEVGGDGKGHRNADIKMTVVNP